MATLTPQQNAQVRQTVETLATLIRELPLRDYLATLDAKDPQRPVVQAMLGVQAALPPIPPNIHRG